MAIERRARAAAETSFYLIVLIGIVVGVNILSNGCGSIRGVYARYDTTRNERFTLSQGSGRLLHTLKQPLDVDVYVTKGLAKLDAFVNELEDLMREYERAGGGKFRYKIIEAKSDEQREAAKEAGLREAAFGEGSQKGEDQASIAQGFMGIVFKYGSERDSIPIINPERTEGLEFWITNSIRALRDKADDLSVRLGVITDKDELKLSEPNLIPPQGRGDPSMQAIIQQNWPFYKFEDVDLKNGDAAIDEGLVGLIITQPNRSYTPREMRRIDEFVMRGRSLMVVVGAANLKASDASMRATLDLHGLDALLTGYGFEVSKNVAIDWGSAMRIQLFTHAGSLQTVLIPGVAHVQVQPGAPEDKQTLNNSFAAFFRVDELAFPYPSAIITHPDRQPNAKMTVVARTSPVSTIIHGDNVVLSPSSDLRPKGSYDQFPIAAAVEGKLKRAIEPPSTSDDIDVPAESKADARVFLIASGNFFANPFVRAGKGPDLGPQFAMMGGNVLGDEKLLMLSQPYAQGYLTNTILAFKNAIDWLAGDSDLLAVSAKVLGEPNLVYPYSGSTTLTENSSDDEIKAENERVRTARTSTQNKIQWTLTLLLPAAFGLLGILLWRHREAKRSTFSV